MPPSRNKSLQRKRFSFAPSQASPQANDRPAFDPLSYGITGAGGQAAGPLETVETPAKACSPDDRSPARGTGSWSPLANPLAEMPVAGRTDAVTPVPKKRRLLPMADFSESDGAGSDSAVHVKREATEDDGADKDSPAQVPPARRPTPSAPRSITSWVTDFSVPKLDSPGPSLGPGGSQTKFARPITELPGPFGVAPSFKAGGAVPDEKKDAKPRTPLGLGDVSLGGGTMDLGAWAAKLSYSPRKGKAKDVGGGKEDKYVRNGLADLARREIRKLSTEHTLFEVEQLRPWLARRQEQAGIQETSLRTGSPSSKKEGARAMSGPTAKSRREGAPPALVLGPIRILGRDSSLEREAKTSTPTKPSREAPTVRPGWSPTRRTTQTQVLLECLVLEVAEGEEEEEEEGIKRGGRETERSLTQVRDADKSGRPLAARQEQPEATSSTVKPGQRLVVVLSASQAGRASAAETALKLILARLGEREPRAGPSPDLVIAAWGPIMTMDLGIHGAGRGREEDAVDTLVITHFAAFQ